MRKEDIIASFLPNKTLIERRIGKVFILELMLKGTIRDYIGKFDRRAIS